MSYLENKEIKIMPRGSYKIIRNCAKCGCKTNYINTNNFRVNANGNCLDVWLIYQCEKCKHTLNISIYTRVNPSEVKAEEYEKLLSNDKSLAFKYGVNRELFSRNKAVINESAMKYDLINIKNKICANYKSIRIYNDYGLKIRMDKLIAETLKMSRSEVREKIKKQLIFSNENYKLDKVFSGNYVEIFIENESNINIA